MIVLIDTALGLVGASALAWLFAGYRPGGRYDVSSTKEGATK